MTQCWGEVPSLGARKWEMTAGSLLTSGGHSPQVSVVQMRRLRPRAERTWSGHVAKSWGQISPGLTSACDGKPCPGPPPVSEAGSCPVIPRFGPTSVSSTWAPSTESLRVPGLPQKHPDAERAALCRAGSPGYVVSQLGTSLPSSGFSDWRRAA